MKMRKLSLGLPLLTRELVEQSARRRTYAIRVCYACLLFVSAFFAFYEVLGAESNDLFAVLGRGRYLLEFVVLMQFAGIYLFLPPSACGVLTAEKERNCLGLLFLTRLGPWAILLEKLLSRMVPMLTFLLLSLPLLAFAYSLGGITQTYLWGGVWLLALTMLQVCSLAVMCSAWFRRTMGAFVGTYLIGLTVIFGLPFLFAWATWELWTNPNADDVVLALFGPYVFLEHAGDQNANFMSVFGHSLPLLASCAVCLLLARLAIVRRAFVPPRHFVLGLFRAADRLFTKMNDNRVTRGIVLIRERTALPDDEPVAWRETTKKSLGTVRYLFRVLVATELPVVAICILLMGAAYDGLEALSALLMFLWCPAVLLVSVKAASLLSSERSQETLDVLLTTPLSARDIVLQKFRGVRRLMLVLAVPFVTIFLVETAWRAGLSSHRTYGYYGRSAPGELLYLTASMLSLVTYLPLAAWLSLLVGMCLKSQGKAIMASLGFIVAWCVVPLMLWIVLPRLIGSLGILEKMSFVLLFSPAAIVPINEYNQYSFTRHLPGGAWLAVLANFVYYGAWMLALRFTCLNLANRLLGRADEMMPREVPHDLAPRDFQ